MSYTDQTRRSSPASIAAVAGAHLVIGYALISGFAYTVIKTSPPHTTVTEVPNEAPPPPLHPVKVPRSKLPTTTPPLTPPPEDNLKAEPTIIPVPPFSELSGTPSGGGLATPPPVELPKPSLARDAVPGADRTRWITSDDYPTAALRQGLTGSVAIAATIGADGHVRSCLVTQSSGSQLLDDTTCRLYMKRGHFTPARDTDGNPTTAQRTDRFRWTIPNE